MQPGNPLKHFLFTFLLALGLYVIAYSAIEHRRVRNGPWRVTFSYGPTGFPEMIVNQPKLGLTNVQIAFTNQAPNSNQINQSFIFDQPRPVPYEVPFGQCLFMDTTFLPGTVTFNLFGHEIELLPRVLIIDHQEHRWMSAEFIPLPSEPSTNTAKATTP